MLTRVSLLFLVAGLGACTQHAFTPTYPDNRPADIELVVQRLRAGTPRQATPVLVGVSDQHEVYLYDLARDKVRWKRPLEVASAPLPIGPLVVAATRSEVLLLDADSGQTQLTVPTQGLGVMGASSDGHISAIALSSGGTMGARGRLLILEDNQLKVDVPIQQPIGAPAVAAGLVFVPWNRVHLVVLEPTGIEIARVSVQKDVVSQALAVGNDIYFGEAGMYRLGTKLSYFRPLRAEHLPGKPAFLTSASASPPPVDSAVQRIFLSFQPQSDSAAIELTSNSLYLTFYKQTFALSPMGSGVHWVHESEQDVVGAKAVPSGILLCDARGELTLLAPSGRPLWHRETGIATLVARIDAADVEPDTSSAGEIKPITEQLSRAAKNRDTRLVPSRTLATVLLSAVAEPEATAELIELCQDREAPERVRRAACQGLGERHTGAEAAVVALAQHADFLSATAAPDVAALAALVARANERAAVAPLIDHLDDPATPIEAWPAILNALSVLADRDAAAPLTAFVELYHADADELPVEKAVRLAMQTLVRVQGKDAIPLLERVANDALGDRNVKAEATRLLASLSAPAPTSPSDPVSAEPNQPVEPGPPEHLKLEHAQLALAPFLEPLKECVRNDPKHPSSARIVMTIAGHDGSVIAVHSLPESVLPCVEPLVRKATFPRTRFGKRENLTYTVMY